MKLSDYRHRQNLSVEQAAAQLGVTPICFRYWERGQKTPGRENMDKIYQWSGGLVQPNDFYTLSRLVPKRCNGAMSGDQMSIYDVPGVP